MDDVRKLAEERAARPVPFPPVQALNLNGKSKKPHW